MGKRQLFDKPLITRVLLYTLEDQFFQGNLKMLWISKDYIKGTQQMARLIPRSCYGKTYQLQSLYQK